MRREEAGESVTDICRSMGISHGSFYRWKKKYAGMGVAELRKLKQLEEENKQLKQLVADLSFDKHMLQDVIKKKALKLVRQREIASYLCRSYDVSQRRSCKVLGFHRQYEAVAKGLISKGTSSHGR